MVNISKSLSGSKVPWDINEEPNPCYWKGINCNSMNSSITGITLSGFSLSSSDFLPIICKLDSLQMLNVSNNRFALIPEEFITDCGKIDGLKRLDFSKNRLVGNLPKFDGFVGLEILDLSYNSLGGKISLELEGLVGLKSLNLSFNQFTGSLPTQLGNSTVLEELLMSVNHFVGTIPVGIMDYRNLRLLDLSQNNLSGSVPDKIGELSKLEVLILSSNKLTGEIPKSLSDITTLLRFAAHQNQFFGSIPSGLTKSLKILDLSYNSLGGSIPSDFLSPQNLQTVDLSNNQLKGSIPTANMSRSLVRLRLGSNQLDGKIPASFEGLKNLMYLELDTNNLTESIPPQLGSCHSLALLDLSQNRLTGTLPGELGKLQSLQVLKLQSNHLTGEIPVEITQLLNLSTLNISGNSLSGPIPSSISRLQKLTSINLQSNRLSGSIPDSLASMTILLELQLGKNQLGGYIPKMPPNLQISLNLSSNLFKGPIPKNLDGLSALEVLDLSNNDFSGEIPEFLTGLKSLTRLILTNNSLSGYIPKFATFVVLETLGNKDLKQAPSPNASPAPRQSKKGTPVAVTVVLAVAAAVFSGLVVTIAVILFSRRYYKVNDEQLQPREDPPLPQVLEGNFLTGNGIHKSNIDFTKAMEAVADPSNIVLKTRFSTYYEAVMPTGSTYYVKKLNWIDKIFQLGSHDKFGNELEAFAKLNNSNVMIPLAYVLTVDSAYLFYEYAPKGTLFDGLHKNMGNDMDWASRYSIAVGVAQGLACLHVCASGPIILLDLSSRNIFLKSLKEPQVGDIELYKVIDPSKSTGSLSTIAGTVGYIPPEYAYTMRVTTAGNVYSFGVILLELLTGKPAVSEGTELAKWVLSNRAQYPNSDHILDFSLSRTSSAVKSQMLAVLKIALGCVNVSPEARPKMKSVLRMLVNAR
ncbi:hypothetical protein FEM48_Zijuj05G0172300 [Ziziphus jujuba var. spinosa]|nr:hypothetical protein FEM48_Zijuj05G0172300 [Ziziphus jujuba var. spinosa]